MIKGYLTAGAQALALCSLWSCASNSSQPYWENQAWDKKLFETVQTAAHYPADDPDQSVQFVHVRVKFVYVEGKAQDLQVIEGTGHPELDAAILQQIAATQLPKAGGGHSAEPHTFDIDVDVNTPFQGFLYAEYKAVSSQAAYPQNAVISGSMGTVAVRFRYLDGQVSDISIATSSGNHDIDAAAMRAVSKAKFPPAPPGFAGQPLNMQVSLCFSLLGPNAGCSQVKHVIQVINDSGTSPSSSGP